MDTEQEDASNNLAEGKTETKCQDTSLSKAGGFGNVALFAWKKFVEASMERKASVEVASSKLAMDPASSVKISCHTKTEEIVTSTPLKKLQTESADSEFDSSSSNIDDKAPNSITAVEFGDVSNTLKAQGRNELIDLVEDEEKETCGIPMLGQEPKDISPDTISLQNTVATSAESTSVCESLSDSHLDITDSCEQSEIKTSSTENSAVTADNLEVHPDEEGMSSKGQDTCKEVDLSHRIKVMKTLEIDKVVEEDKLTRQVAVAGITLAHLKDPLMHTILNKCVDFTFKAYNMSPDAQDDIKWNGLLTMVFKSSYDAVQSLSMLSRSKGNFKISVGANYNATQRYMYSVSSEPEILDINKMIWISHLQKTVNEYSVKKWFPKSNKVIIRHTLTDGYCAYIHFPSLDVMIQSIKACKTESFIKEYHLYCLTPPDAILDERLKEALVALDASQEAASSANKKQMEPLTSQSQSKSVTTEKNLPATKPAVASSVAKLSSERDDINTQTVDVQETDQQFVVASKSQLGPVVKESLPVAKEKYLGFKNDTAANQPTKTSPMSSCNQNMYSEVIKGSNSTNTGTLGNGPNSKRKRKGKKARKHLKQNVTPLPAPPLMAPPLVAPPLLTPSVAPLPLAKDSIPKLMEVKTHIKQNNKTPSTPNVQTSLVKRTQADVIQKGPPKKRKSKGHPSYHNHNCSSETTQKLGNWRYGNAEPSHKPVPSILSDQFADSYYPLSTDFNQPSSGRKPPQEPTLEDESQDAMRYLSGFLDVNSLQRPASESGRSFAEPSHRSDQGHGSFRSRRQRYFDNSF